MKKIQLLLSSFIMMGVSAQVGINTQTPAGTLDVNGNLFIRTTPASPTAASYNVLAVNATTKEVQVVNTNLQSAVNPTIVKAQSTGVSLLTVGVFQDYQKINFSIKDIDTGPTATPLFNLGTGIYTAPSAGIYEIYYEFKYGQGVQVALVALGAPPSIGILKTTGGTTSLISSRTFNGVNAVAANIIISSSSIDSIFRLAQGDQISFAYNSGGIGVNLLSSSFALAHIRKISD